MQELRMNHSYRWRLISIVLALALVGCGKHDKITAPGPGAPPVSDQWTETAGPEVAYTQSIVTSGATLVAAMEGGMYRSTDHGNRWIPTFEGSTAHVLALGSTLYGVSSGRILRSTDEGLTWTPIATLGITIYSLAGGDPGLFVGTQTGLLRSTDGGVSWNPVTDGLTTLPVAAIAVDGTTVFAGTWGGGVYRSLDGGSRWMAIGPVGNRVMSISAGGSTVFMVGYDGAYRSLDSGDNWTSLSTGPLAGLELRSLIVRGTTLLVGANSQGVFRSTDGGDHWTAATPRITPNAFTVDGATLFAGGGMGVYRSSDDGETWTPSRGGLTVGTVPALLSQGVLQFAAGGVRGAGVSRTLDAGASWEYRTLDFPDQGVAALWATPTGILAGTIGDPILKRDPGIFRSSDGVNWTRTIGVFSHVHALAGDDTELFAGSSGGLVYRSIDAGVHWTPVAGALPNSAVVALVMESPTVFAGTSGSGVFRSTDHGASWDSANNGLTSMDIHALAVFGTTLLAGTGTGGVFRSTDGGGTWVASNDGLNSTFVHAFTVVGTSIFVGTNSGVFRSTNGGVHWTPFGSGFSGQAVASLAADGTHLFAGTFDRGVWRVPLTP